uniref:Uncharacterized protein n=1 Tax=Chelonoidis abingdonii TaxID=106734 RepID=A0A8C0GMY8_CHEAB
MEQTQLLEWEEDGDPPEGEADREAPQPVGRLHLLSSKYGPEQGQWCLVTPSRMVRPHPSEPPAPWRFHPLSWGWWEGTGGLMALDGGILAPGLLGSLPGSGREVGGLVVGGGGWSQDSWVRSPAPGREWALLAQPGCQDSWVLSPQISGSTPGRTWWGGCQAAGSACRPPRSPRPMR